MILTILNLNIMHGRNSRNSVFPIIVSAKKVKVNIEKISLLIKNKKPDVITLQEIDQYSLFAGKFNQVDYLNKQINYPYRYFYQNTSIKILKWSIFVTGTAIFSKYPLENYEFHSFSFSFPTPRKGFVVADLKLPNNKTITISSVHLVYLDYLRSNSRLQQVGLINKIISTRKNPVVIAGDFNCDLNGAETLLQSLMTKLRLKAYDPENQNLMTHPSWKPSLRIDWVLPSREINFLSYEVLSDRVSDHLAIFAKLSLF